MMTSEEPNLHESSIADETFNTTNVPLALPGAQTTPTATSVVAAPPVPPSLVPPVQMPNHYPQLHSDYIRRRYRRKYENPEKAQLLLTEMQALVENLQTAIAGRMEAAVIGVLHQIILVIDNGILYSAEPPIGNGVNSLANEAGDRQRALCKAGIAPVMTQLLRDLGGSVALCVKALHCIAYLIRVSDEVKTAVCLENAKTLAQCGICECVVAAIKHHKVNKSVMMQGCDALRCLCALESNRERLGAAGACEALARALPVYAGDAELLCWLCRAIGHLAAPQHVAANNSYERNREVLSGSGACESLILSLQKYPLHTQLCVEACYAVRQLSVNDKARERLLNDFGVESILAVFKTHLAAEAFAIESCHALCNLLTPSSEASSEEKDCDEWIIKLANSGFVSLAVKALKKSPQSEFLPRFVFQLFYLVACLSDEADNKPLAGRIVTSEVLDALSVSLENHASCESLSEWACRLVHSIVTVENASSKMRNAGMCEMVTSAVQRQAISTVVCSVGCLAIGDLACDPQNISRLSSSGACEAVVGALKRHNSITDVVFNSSYAIHHLCASQNNVSWMGAYGACEAVINALGAHIHEEEVAKYGINALGSLALDDEGNQLRIFHAKGNECIVQILTIHAEVPDVIENTCRCIYNLCAESNHNVNELGKNGVCSLVVAALQTHANAADVITQVLLAISGLAVRQKTSVVHRGNTRKLVEQGAIENIVAVMQKFADKENVQRAAGLAIASLARQETNRARLGAVGACELLSHALQLHINSASVAGKLALAIDQLAQDNDTNKAKFTALLAIDNLINALIKHEKISSCVADLLRAIITLSSVEVNRPKAFTEAACRLYVRLLKLHEKSASVAQWGCHVLYVASQCDENDKCEVVRERLGNLRACENIVNVLSRHAEADKSVAEFGCKAIVGLSVNPANRERFHDHSDTASALVKALSSHTDDAVVVEWSVAAALPLLQSFHSERDRLGNYGACKAVVQALAAQHSNENILRLCTEVVYELALSHHNQSQFYAVNVCDVFLNVLIQHSAHPVLTSHICRAIYSLASHHYEMASKFLEVGIAPVLVPLLRQHLFSTSVVQWAASALVALCSVNSKPPITQTAQAAPTLLSSLSSKTTKAPQVPRSPQVWLGDKSLRLFEHIALCMHTHTRAPLATVTALLRCVRALCVNCPENQVQVTRHGMLLPLSLQLLRLYSSSDAVVEQAAWVLGSIEYKPIKPRGAVVVRTPTMPVNDSSSTKTSATDAASGELKSEDPPALSSPSKKSIASLLFTEEESEKITDPADPPTDAAQAVQAAPEVVIMMSSRELYGDRAHWDLLYAALNSRLGAVAVANESISRNPTAGLVCVRWLCQAVSLFAEKGRLSHKELCHLLMTLMERSVEQELVLQKVLFAIGSLSRANAENNNAFCDLNALEMLNDLFKANKDYHEGNIVAYGLFAAIAGLTETYSGEDHTSTDVKSITITQDHVALLSSVIPNTVRLLYNDLESDQMAQFGCQAIAALVRNHEKNQRAFSPACNFLADVAFAHKYPGPTSTRVLTPTERANVYAINVELCKAVSLLAHMNMLNRNRLGSNDACTAVLLAITSPNKSDEEINRSWKAYSQSLLFWAVRAVGDLAANHTQNQRKLGAQGACELLVQVLEKRRSLPGEFDAECRLFALVFWAIGNLVSGSLSSSLVDENETVSPSLSISAVAQMTSLSPLKSSSALGQVGSLSKLQDVKNTTRFYELSLSSSLNDVLRRYISSALVCQWACRAINTLAKSQRLKVALKDSGVLDAVHSALEQHGSTSQETREWAQLAKETLSVN